MVYSNIESKMTPSMIYEGDLVLDVQYQNPKKQPSELFKNLIFLAQIKQI